MFESAEIGHRISDADYKRKAPKLRTALLKAQYELLEQARFPVLLVIGGVDGAGKGETVNLLNEWMDPRHIQTHAFGPPSEEDRAHPRMARYWRTLPPKGRIGLYFGSWYTDPIVDQVYRRSRREEFDQAIDSVLRFERMLHEEGALILKFWLHLSKKAQRKRLRTLEKDPLTRWRVTGEDWDRFRHYDRFSKVSERTLRNTSTAFAPWFVVEGTDANYRSLAVGRALLAALRDRLGAAERPPHPADTPPLLAPVDNLHLLDATDTDRRLGRKQYERELPKQQGRLNRLSRHKHFHQRGVVAVFEGPDAGGKGGAIRRITGALDARFYQVIPVAAPTDEELAQPYLWRFWRRIPRAGRFTIFDRSWYGRVLVERIEGYCSESDWMRAYGEINDFEEQLAESGIVVAKFWLAISPEEQLRRFKEREETGYKRYKITADDWRNRKKWDAYQQAAGDMIDRTSTGHAPWTIVEANDKHYARIKVLETLNDRIEAALDAD
jgi:AMP-polyphosphate phosphotransferase